MTAFYTKNLTIAQKSFTKFGATVSRLYAKLAIVLFIISFVAACEPKPMSTSDREPVALRVAAFNVSMDASNYVPNEQLASAGASALANALAQQHPQIRAIAEIIQHTRPDVLVLNEFDYDPSGAAVKSFQRDYLAVSQQGESPIDYPYSYTAAVNTGVMSPYDLNRDGKASADANDAWGYGWYPGQYGMVVLSRYPIDEAAVRTFQQFKWADMPGALRPLLPGTSSYWYGDDVWADMPLSSKSHWDVPVQVHGRTLHILVSHPTPPVFDGEENRNGRRNYDEVRFWADYLRASHSDYIYDDQGRKGGLAEQQRFVIAGDLNASNEGKDNVPGTIEQLLEHPLVNAQVTPASRGGAAHSPDNEQGRYHTAGWRKRADYVLPSQFGIEVIDAGVFWPLPGEPKADLVAQRNRSSDHRLVWIDILLTQ